MDSESLILRLLEVDAIKFGTFRLKSGVESPIYFDLRVIVSYPSLLAQVGEKMWEKIQENAITMDCLCGVPYTALPIATYITTSHGVPMVMRRKEVKSYGTRRAVEGVVKAGQQCVVIEDVVTTGGSVLETVDVLKSAGLQCTYAVVLLNREQGGAENLSAHGIQLISVITVNEVLNVLVKRGKVEETMAQRVRDFINGCTPSLPIVVRNLRYSERVESCNSTMGKKLFNIMEKKQTNLAFSADVSDSQTLLKVISEVAPHVCIVKTHIDTLPDFDITVARQLKDLSEEYNFIIMEDRKFGDIGNTCKLQYSNTRYHMDVGWAGLVTAHGIPGNGMLKALKEVSPKGSGCVLVASMSSQGCLTTPEYAHSVLQMAEENQDFVVGVVCQRKLSEHPGIIHMTPGVHFSSASDTLGQQYNTPEEVIGCRLTDLVIVGRGIYQSPTPASTAKAYRERAYKAYQASLPREVEHS